MVSLPVWVAGIVVRPWSRAGSGLPKGRLSLVYGGGGLRLSACRGSLLRDGQRRIEALPQPARHVQRDKPTDDRIRHA